MNYDESVNYIHSLLKFGIKPGLERIGALLNNLGNPQNNLKFIHVAGTNGKGSVCTMLSEILQDAGYKTGLFTSPYVVDFRERFQINSKMIERDVFTQLVNLINPYVTGLAGCDMQPTEFEVITAIAMKYFEMEKCDVVVLETGLGGRLDSTNIISSSLLSIITSISFDHMGVLGNTIEEITAEKCGIIKDKGTVVCYPLHQEKTLKIIKESAARKENELIIPDAGSIKVGSADLSGTEINFEELQIKIPLVGEYQIYNAVTAISAAKKLNEKVFKISSRNIVTGIEKVKIPARFEIVKDNPLVIIDGGHNADGINVLVKSIKTFLKDKKKIVVMGMMEDKEYPVAIGKIAALADKFIATTPSNPRALNSLKIQILARNYCKDTINVENPAEAYKHAVSTANNNDVIIICGSLYLASDIKDFMYRSE